MGLPCPFLFYGDRRGGSPPFGDASRRSTPTLFLFGFEVTPGEIARVAHIPEAIDLGRIGTGRGPFIGEINTVDRQVRQVPGIDE